MVLANQSGSLPCSDGREIQELSQRHNTVRKIYNCFQKEYTMAFMEATSSINIAETVTSQRKIPHWLTWNTIKPIEYTRYSNLPPMPLPTPAAIRSVEGDCSLQPEGYGPIPKYDNMLAFHLSPEIQDIAANAATPPGYIQTFVSANGSFFGTHYLGHYELQSYDVLECFKRCNEWGQSVNSTHNDPIGQASSQNPDQASATTMELGDDGYARQAKQQVCQGFNVYFERSPAIQLGPECRESESRTIIKCALWGEPLRIQGATNVGYREWDFDVAIAGSNGYNLEKYAEAENMAAESKLSKAVVVALFVAQVILGIMVF